MKVAVSYLKSDNYKECIKKISNTSAEYIHADLCDGKFVETKNFTLGKIVEILGESKKPLDIHLMVQNPLKYIDALASLNTDTITFHLDGDKDPEKTIDYILSTGIKVGIALSPKDDISALLPYIDKIDKVIILSVVPGKGGQAFMSEVLTKVDELNKIKGDYHFEIEMDGGINDTTILELADKDIDIVVSGSYITESNDYDYTIKMLQSYK